MAAMGSYTIQQAPALYDGAVMDQATFHKLYEQSAEGFRAQLIGGRVQIMPPISDDHSASHTDATGWLISYRNRSPGTAARITPTVVLGPGSEPEPDVCLRILESHGGRSHVQGKYIYGPPEIMVEISISSANDDLDAKKRDYQLAGVEEYLVILPEEHRVLWFYLRDGEYHLIEPGPDGIIRSRQFPGLWLDPAALLSGNHARVQETLDQGLASPEHIAWVAKMAPKGS